MKFPKPVMIGAVMAASVLGVGTSAFAEAAKTVVLVHGAFADGSSWNRVIPLLNKAGLKTIAVQNPLSSLEDDVAFTNRALEQAEGSVVLVGHSWGGMVITDAGVHDKVKSLVYVAAFAPSKEDTLHSLYENAKPVPGLAEPIVDAEGYIAMSEDAVITHFAQDLPVEEAKLIAATQGKINSKGLDAKVTNEAWKVKPNWFVVSQEDHMIHPDLMRDMAKKINATTVELPTSHVPMLSKPQEVANVIIEASKAQ